MSDAKDQLKKPTAPLSSISSLPGQHRKRRKARNKRVSMLGANFGSALEALWGNRLRSVLTALGIVIGVGAVIAAITLTQGASTLINGRVANLGTNALTITPGATNTGGVAGAIGSRQSLTLDDANSLVGVQYVAAVSPILTVNNGQVIYGNQNWNTRIQGVTPDLQRIQGWTVASGAWFTTDDNTNSSLVAVLGQTVASNLFDATGTDPLGQTIRIKNQLFTVVGVLAPKGALGASNQDDIVYVPFSAAAARLKQSSYVDLCWVCLGCFGHVADAQQSITTLLEERHKLPTGGPDDFQIRSSNQLVQTAQQFSQTLTLLLVGIAAISLTVGGIGIMNIMLVSVTERTREIGIRMAIGARRSDIRNQFLIESLTLSSVGGLIGITIGLGVGLILTRVFQLPFGLNILAIVMSFLVSAIIGMVFGLYPAIRASRLDPIVALRAE